ncbi:MAG: hypothetical protein K2X86_01705 [Cytophagaceae bacterium]|nr:hypothetical protein [Cytophagaceae bacterium]
MEKRIIYFNRKKAFLNLAAGVGLILAMGVVRSIYAIALFFIGGSFIYFGLKSISKEPQFIISDEGLYIGYKFKKNISWGNIVKVAIRDLSVDFRKVQHLELTVRINVKVGLNTMIKQFPVDNLDITPKGLEILINERLTNIKNSNPPSQDVIATRPGGNLS